MRSDMRSRMMIAAMALTTGAVMGQMTGQQPPSGSTTGGAGTQQQTPSQMGTMPGSGMGNMNGSGMGAAQDKMFAKKALAGGMAEVQLGQLALTKSNSDDVKKFAQTMIDDHTKLGDQMKPIAAQVGVQPPADLMPKDKKVMTQLQGLSGDAFDKAYIKDMVKDHKEDDKDFMMEASNGKFPAEKDAAAQGDPIIKSHLQMAQQLAQAHNVAAK